MKELTRQCLALPTSKRAQLIRILEKSLINDSQKADGINERFNALLAIAESIVGKGILGKFKDTELVIGRRMIAYQMRQDGYPLKKVGNLLKKNHATILHMERMMADAIRYHFRPELTYWEEFKRKLQEYEEKISSEVV
jgi:hypothetical protein